MPLAGMPVDEHTTAETNKCVGEQACRLQACLSISASQQRQASKQKQRDKSDKLSSRVAIRRRDPLTCSRLRIATLTFVAMHFVTAWQSVCSRLVREPTSVVSKKAVSRYTRFSNSWVLRAFCACAHGELLCPCAETSCAWKLCLPRLAMLISMVE